MSIDNKEWLRSTNDFAQMGLKFLYLSNAGAIIAILANVNNFVEEEDYPTISCAFGFFAGGLVFALLATLFGFLMYRSLLMVSQSQRKGKGELFFSVLTLSMALVSLSCFVLGAYKAVSIIKSVL